MDADELVRDIRAHLAVERRAVDAAFRADTDPFHNGRRMALLSFHQWFEARVRDRVRRDDQDRGDL